MSIPNVANVIYSYFCLGYYYLSIQAYYLYLQYNHRGIEWVTKVNLSYVQLRVVSVFGLLAYIRYFILFWNKEKCSKIISLAH